MRVGVIIGLAAAALLATAVAASDVRETRVDQAWRGCLEAPTRACVAARALALTRAIDEPPAQAAALDQLLGTAGDLALPGTVALGRQAEAIARASRDDAAGDDMWLSIATAYAKARAFAVAGAVLARFRNPRLEGEAVVQIAVGIGHARRVEAAVQLLRSQRTTKDDWRAWMRAAWALRAVAVARSEEAALLPMLQEAQAAKNAVRGGPGDYGGVHHPSRYTEPLLIVVAEQTAQGKTRAALAIARAVGDTRARTHIVGGVSAVLAFAGRTDEALEVALASPADEQGQVIGIVLIPEIAALSSDLLTGPFPKIARPAASAFGASMRLAERFATGDDRDMAYAVIALANAREDAVANAVQAAASINGLFFLRTALTEVGEAQARAGDRAASVATFARVRELIGSEPDDQGWEWREASLSDLAKRQARAGQIEEALAIVRSMKGNEMTAVAVLNDGRQISLDYNRRMALYEIARALAKAGRVDEAFEVARSVESAELGGLDNGLGVVAEGLADAGRIDDALRALKVMPEESRRDDTLLDILRQRLSAGVTAEADKLLAAIAAFDHRALATGEVAAAFLKAGDAPGALALVKQALALADTLPHAHQAAGALCQAMRGLAA